MTREELTFMRVRKLGILVAAAMAALGLYSTPAHAQLPELDEAYAPTAVCVVAGTVQLSDGVVIPPQAENPEDEGGTYSFSNVLLVCAGVVTGNCSAQSDGTTAGLSPTSGFMGDFHTDCAPTGQHCDGQIGGPALAPTGTPPPPPPLPAGFPDGQWSFTAGPLLLASLDEVTCTPGPVAGLPPGISDGDGLFAALAAPNPAAPATCEDVTAPNPAPAPAGLLYTPFCGIVIAGVAVLLTEVIDLDPSS
jgi:hypothetical protein